MRRVVVTGIGINTPIGHTLDDVSHALRNDVHGIKHIADFDRIEGLRTRLGGEVTGLDLTSAWHRQRLRSMGRVALLAAHATSSAIADSGLSSERIAELDVGLAYGSTHGSSIELERFCRKVFAKDSLDDVPSTAYLRFMSHTTAANLAGLFGIHGRVISTCAACVSASQAVGAGYETIRAGVQTVMICGGAEELHWVPAGVFDVLFATSIAYNDRPSMSPRPFDKARDGLVIAEGAGTVVLEEHDHAVARGAHIYAEIIGYGTNCDGGNVTSPSAEGMTHSMALSLRDAQLSASEIDYVNAHGTGTIIGDVSESHAMLKVFGDKTPVSSTKAFTGHTLGACGTIELAFCVAMMRDGFLAPTRNLAELDPACASLDYVVGGPRNARPTTVMTNNFAFGGINTSIILRSGS